MNNHQSAWATKTNPDPIIAAGSTNSSQRTFPPFNL
jgi:hypothetical protein